MYRLFSLSILIVSVVVSFGCDDQAVRVMKPVVEQPTENIDYANLPLIDSYNLPPGLYQMNIYAGTKFQAKGNVVSIVSERFEGENAVEVTLYPSVHDLFDTYFNGAKVVIQIYAKRDIFADYYGIHGNEVTIHSYHGTIIAFLKQPDAGTVVYRYQPTGYENLPVLNNVFATGGVQPGQYLVFPFTWSFDVNKKEVIDGIFTKIVEEDVVIRLYLRPRPLIVGKNNQLLFDYRHNGYVVEITEYIGRSTVTVDGVLKDSYDYTGKLIQSFSKPYIEPKFEEVVEEGVSE